MFINESGALMFKTVLSMLRAFVIGISAIFVILGILSGLPGMAIIFGAILILMFIPEIIKAADAIAALAKQRKSKKTAELLRAMGFEDIFNSLKEFLGQISNDKDVRDFVRNHIAGVIQIDGKNIKNATERIEILLDLDVVLAFSKTGFQPDDKKTEQLLALYSGICDAHLHSRTVNRQAYFSQLSNYRLSDQDKIYLGHCLRNVDMDYLRKYYSILLSLSRELMDMQDGDTSEDAKKWIEGLQMECHKGEKKAESHSPTTDAMTELNSLIGLDSVKAQVRSLMNFVKVMQQRETKGLKAAPVSYHCVFTGNPGTGKTTVARIVARIYSELGILKKGHLVETDRSGLVAEYVGQTAVKTNKLIDKALDGVLFIDEAYTLFVKESPMDFGPEAIATLLKRMEDDRNRLVVVLAGYTQEMNNFMEANPGLKSRFNRYIEFPDYTVENLQEIFLANIRNYEYHLTPEAEESAFRNFAEAVAQKDRHFGNGRFVRNVFEKMVECQADRVSKEVNPDVRTLMDILPSDVAETFASLKRQ